MIIRVNGVDYAKLRNIDFAPETDIIGKSIPINRFTVEVQTGDAIMSNTLVYLLGADASVWAYYWITDSYKVDSGWVRVIAQSTMILLDRYTLPAKMYDGTESFNDVIGEIFYSIQTVFPSMTIVSVDPSFSSTVISGYAPEQTARERLLWVLFCARAYVKSFFNSYTEILPVDDAETLIPADKTFWKPEIKVNDYVTEIKIRAYTYTLTQTEPARTDKFVKVGNDVYIQTDQDYSLRNSNLPAGVPISENVITIQKNTLVNQSNVQTLLADLAEYYFNRYTISADVLNTGELLPGDKVIVSNTENLFSGYIKSAQFEFGHSAKSSIDVQVASAIEAGSLDIICLYGSEELKRFWYLLPVGYVYSIENPYLDLYNEDVRRIYRPVNEYATGVVASGGSTDEEQYEIALEAEEQEVLVLIVNSVSGDDVVSIG